MSTAVSSLVTMAGSILSTCVADETLVLFVAAPVVAIAIGIVHKLVGRM